MIRRTMVLSLLCFCFLTSIKATGQSGELIIIGKDTFEVLACPLDYDGLLSTEVAKRLSGRRSTGCWRGYVGIWRLESQTLYLEKIRDYESYGSKAFQEKLVDLTGVFDTYKDSEERIVAT